MRRLPSLIGVMLVITAAAQGCGRPESGRAPPPDQEPRTPDPRLEQAVAWYTGTAGHVDDMRARDLLLAVAAEGDPMARMWVARCYSRGRMGFMQDTVGARHIAGEVIGDILDLAQSGVPEAMFLMGTAHDEGLGVDEDPVEAVMWFRRAAAHGHTLAEHNLGNAYYSGRGVGRNDSAAVAWWTEAAADGDAIPQLRLGMMYEEGRGVARNVETALAWYARAAGRGVDEAGAAIRRLSSR